MPRTPDNESLAQDLETAQANIQRLQQGATVAAQGFEATQSSLAGLRDQAKGARSDLNVLIWRLEQVERKVSVLEGNGGGLPGTVARTAERLEALELRLGNIAKSLWAVALIIISALVGLFIKK